MTSRRVSDPHEPWFRALTDHSPDVYFRYRLDGTSGAFDYLSPAVQALTGHAADAFIADPKLCARLFAKADRRALRQALRSRRALTFSLTLRMTSRHDDATHAARPGTTNAAVTGAREVTLQVRTVPVIRRHQLIAVEGVASSSAPSARDHDGVPTPVQQQLTALLYQVHSLLHLNPPPAHASPSTTIRLGAMQFDTERLTVSESGVAVRLTGRELLVLRHLLTRQGRIVTREQLLKDVWKYSYTGDARTVDVHMSRLRRKLPSLRERLVAIKNIGYRLDDEDACSRESVVDSRKSAI